MLVELVQLQPLLNILRVRTIRQQYVNGIRVTVNHVCVNSDFVLNVRREGAVEIDYLHIRIVLLRHIFFQKRYYS